MSDIPSVPPPSRLVAWAGGVLYFLAVGLLIGGAPQASGTVLGLGAMLAATLLVGVLRRAPLLALVLALLGSSVVLAGAPADLSDAYRSLFLAYLSADLFLGFVVATLARRASALAAAGAFLVQFLMIGGFTHGSDMIGNVVITVLAMAAACTAGQLSRERRQHAVALRTQEVSEAVVAERLRIARELHDMVAHSIGIIAIQAGAGSRVVRTHPEEAREALCAIEVTSREALSGLRRTVVALRQADPDAGASGRASLAPSPGLADLERLAAATADAGVRVEVRRSGQQRPLPADIDLSAYRIVQEALTNVVRHAGTGGCRVTVDYGDEELSVEIVDDGRGGAGDEAAHGFGIVGMRERVALLHGRFSAGPRPGGGFRVAARLPLPQPAGVALEAR
ncbi:sensor histidine kinase [Streptomyces sp. NPDC047990]|uniref:sensor histidine kinase n=1 Tax=Streptomyces sp. NPDC047990 TaxID=3365496 RepID=UPI003721C240